MLCLTYAHQHALVCICINVSECWCVDVLMRCGESRGHGALVLRSAAVPAASPGSSSLPLCAVHQQTSVQRSLNPDSLIPITFHLLHSTYCPTAHAQVSFTKEYSILLLLLWCRLLDTHHCLIRFFLPPPASHNRRKTLITVLTLCCCSSQITEKSAVNYYWTDCHVFLESRAVAILLSALFLSCPAGISTPLH